MRIHELREQKANRVAEMRGMVDKAAGEKRDLSENENSRFEVLKGEVTGLEVRIGQAETLANFERHAEATPVGGTGGLEGLEARYSIGKALAEFNETGRLTGAEGEFAAEHRSGRNGFAVPTSILLGSEQRAVLTTQPVAGPGGVLVPTALGPLIDRPRPSLAVQRLGASVLTGLVGNLDLPRLKSSGTAGWVGEHQEGPQGDPTFDKLSMSPKTVTGNYEVSRRMMLQAPQIEQILRADLGFLLSQQLDLAATFGPGTGNAPRGIKFTKGVKKFTGVFEANPTYGPTTGELDILFGGMIGAVAAADISGSMGFLANPLVKSTLFMYRNGMGAVIGPEGIFQGERAEYSTQIPANLGSSANQTTIFYGAWADLVLGYWSSVDIVLNPYADSVAKKGGALLHAFLDADVAVRHPESFAFTENFPVKSAPYTAVA